MVHLASMHQVSCGATSKLNKQVIIKQILEHKCVTCPKLISAFVPIRTIQSLAEQQYNHRQKKLQPLQKNKIPQAEHLYSLFIIFIMMQP